MINACGFPNHGRTPLRGFASHFYSKLLFLSADLDPHQMYRNFDF